MIIISYNTAFEAEPESRKNLRCLAELVREELGIAIDQKYIDITWVLERLDVLDSKYSYEIVEDDQLEAGVQAQTDVLQNTIYIKESVYTGIYIKELNHNQEGFTRKQFKKKISDDDETEIFTALHSRYPDESQDDVNFSADQSNLLTRAISDEQIKGFPQIFNDENKLNVEETYQFFLKLAHIFNLNLYERKFVHADSDENIQHQTLEDYAKLTLMWISGYSLKQICDYVIAIRERLDFQFLDRLDQSRKLVGNINWDTIAINITMNQLNKLNFVLGKYFLKISKELSANGILLDNNWYQYLEYGTNSDLRIWLQQNGYSRESSQYIENNANDLIINSPSGRLISNRINYVNDPDVINETKEIEVNVPEIFY